MIYVKLDWNNMPQNTTDMGDSNNNCFDDSMDLGNEEKIPISFYTTDDKSNFD